MVCLSLLLLFCAFYTILVTIKINHIKMKKLRTKMWSTSTSPLLNFIKLTWLEKRVHGGKFRVTKRLPSKVCICCQSEKLQRQIPTQQTTSTDTQCWPARYGGMASTNIPYAPTGESLRWKWCETLALSRQAILLWFHPMSNTDRLFAGPSPLSQSHWSPAALPPARDVLRLLFLSAKSPSLFRNTTKA